MAASASDRARPAWRKPNFVFLIADDHAGYVMGCDGNRQAETPNLDRLAVGGHSLRLELLQFPCLHAVPPVVFYGADAASAGVTTLSPRLSDPAKPTLAKN